MQNTEFLIFKAVNIMIYCSINTCTRNRHVSIRVSKIFNRKGIASQLNNYKNISNPVFPTIFTLFWKPAP